MNETDGQAEGEVGTDTDHGAEAGTDEAAPVGEVQEAGPAEVAEVGTQAAEEVAEEAAAAGGLTVAERREVIRETCRPSLRNGRA